jgi:hypothetical protein
MSDTTATSETPRVLPPRYFQGIKSYRFVDYGEAAAYLE